MNSAILAGMRVVEASAFVAAPLGGMTLAQMGAEVIRIDPLQGGLDYRRWPVTAENVSLFWCGLNKSKRSVALNTSTPEGRELAQAIVCAPGDDAGILLTNFPPRGWLSYESLAARRPDLIQFTIQGDRNGASAVDYTVNPRMGLPLLTGPQDIGQQGAAHVVNHVLPAWDLVTGQMAATGLLAAERHRSRTGAGQHVKLALEDVALAVMGHLGFIAEAQLGFRREGCGNYLYGAFGRDFLCSDGVRIMVVALTLKQWRSLRDAMELKEAIATLEATLGLSLDDEGNRFCAREELARLVACWVGARTFAEVQKALDLHGVCWGKYQSVSELVACDPACSFANPMFSEIEQPGVGSYLAPGHPLEFLGVESSATTAAPRLGQHTEEVLSGLLGLPSAELALLHDRGVVKLS